MSDYRFLCLCLPFLSVSPCLPPRCRVFPKAVHVHIVVSDLCLFLRPPEAEARSPGGVRVKKARATEERLG